MPILVSDNVQNISASDLRTCLNGQLGIAGVVHFFDGILPSGPADPDDGTELVTCAMASTPFLYFSGNAFEADTIAPGTVFADGTLAYWRMKDSLGNVVAQGSCGTSGLSDIVFDNDAVLIGDTVTVTDFSATLVIGGV